MVTKDPTVAWSRLPADERRAVLAVLLTHVTAIKKRRDEYQKQLGLNVDKVLMEAFEDRERSFRAAAQVLTHD